MFVGRENPPTTLFFSSAMIPPPPVVVMLSWNLSRWGHRTSLCKGIARAMRLPVPVEDKAAEGEVAASHFLGAMGVLMSSSIVGYLFLCWRLLIS